MNPAKLRHSATATRSGVALAGVLLAFGLWLMPAVLTSPAVAAVAPTVLASNIGDPGNIVIDNSTVYWGDLSTGQISSVSKNPGGVVTHYTTPMNAGGDLVQDGASLYFIGSSFVNGFSIYKMSKAGGSVTTVGDHTAAYGYGSVAIGPAGGILYYNSDPHLHNIPGTNLQTSVIASVSTSGGAETVLLWDGHQYPGELQRANLKYWPSGLFESPSTDSTFLYWEDDDNIWYMPLVGGLASTIVSGRTSIHDIATPTTGAAAGSIFWTEGGDRLMRRKVDGQIITVLTNVISPFLLWMMAWFSVIKTAVWCKCPSTVGLPLSSLPTPRLSGLLALRWTPLTFIGATSPVKLCGSPGCPLLLRNR